MLAEMGDSAGALAALSQVAGANDPAKLDPRQEFLIRAHQVGILCNLDRHREARALLAYLRSCAAQISDALHHLRAQWLEGQVAAGLDRWPEAIILLTEVRQEFIARGIAYDAALVTLDLAAV